MCVDVSLFGTAYILPDCFMVLDGCSWEFGEADF